MPGTAVRAIAGIVAAAPWSRRATQRESHPQALEHVAQEEPFLSHQDAGERLNGASNGKGYGSVGTAGPSSGRSSRRNSPEVHRREGTLNRVPEEELMESPTPILVEEDTEEIDYDLAERGLYSGSYRRILAMYTFVPLTSLALLGFFAFCPTLFWRTRTEDPKGHAPYFPTPIPELILSASLWSFGYLLRAPLYTLVSYALQRCPSVLGTLTFNLLYVTLYNLLRLSSLPILRIREDMKRTRPTWHDNVFQRVWWLAMGWATVDVAVGIAQSYAQLALYRHVMVSEERAAEVLADGNGIESHTPHLVSASQEILALSPRNEGPKAGTESPSSLDEAIRLAVDQDLEQLINLKDREDVEEIYGVPVIKTPVFVPCLQRIASILLSVGITLVMSAAYLHSSLSNPIGVPALSDLISSNNKPFTIAFPLIVSLNLFLNILHTPLVLPRIGVHTAAYISFLLGLGAFFIGLGLWGALA